MVIEINIDNDQMNFHAVDPRHGDADCLLTREQAMAEIAKGAKVRLYSKDSGNHRWSDPVSLDKPPTD